MFEKNRVEDKMSITATGSNTNWAMIAKNISVKNYFKFFFSPEVFRDLQGFKMSKVKNMPETEKHAGEAYRALRSC